MSNERQIYLLDPQDYPPETIAVALPKLPVHLNRSGRSPELNDEKASISSA